MWAKAMMLTEKMPITAIPRMTSSVMIREPDSVAAVICPPPLSRCFTARRGPFVECFLGSGAGGGGAGDRGMLAHRLELHPGQAAPQPFERAVVEPVKPGLRPGEHQQPYRRNQQPSLEPRDLAIKVAAETVKHQHANDRAA